MTEARRRADDAALIPEGLELALQALPLFPLPGTVFFPHTLLPLHVFEPRYRQMTEDVIASHRHIAVVLLDQTAPGCLGVPPSLLPGLAAVGGVGRIVHHERLPDGRFHILLQGIGRAELMAELPPEGFLYRRARARSVTLTHSDRETIDVIREVATLRSCYARLLEVCPDHKDTLGDLPLKIQEPAVLADVVCAAVLEDPIARQAALEEKSLACRLRIANDVLATLLLEGMGTESVPMQ